MKKLSFQTLGLDHLPKIIILHGFLGAGKNWKQFAKAFEKTHQVFLVDLRNHGTSFHSDQISYQLMADDLFEFCLDQALDNLIFIGHSMGGKILLKILSENEKRATINIKQTFVLDIGFWHYDNGDSQKIVSILNQLDLERFNSRALLEEDLITKLHQNDIEASSSLAAFLLTNATFDGQRFTWRSNIKHLDQNSAFLNQKIEFANDTQLYPIFIRGGKSTYIPNEKLDLLHQTLPHAKVHTIEKASHWLHVDAQQELIEIIKGYL